MRYLAYQYVPCPDTMFIEVKQIAPAHALVLENGSIHSFSYWELPPADDRSTISEKEASGELRRLMTQAVRRRMISDVPLGLFLSGGIDSSIVCGLMAGISDKPVETFSIGFKEASFDETSYARCVAQAFATHHHERILYASECADILPDVVSRMDVPMADASVAPTWLLSKVTREKVTVALGGDGSDELWAGYEHYIGFALAQKYREPAPGSCGRAFSNPCAEGSLRPMATSTSISPRITSSARPRSPLGFAYRPCSRPSRQRCRKNFSVIRIRLSLRKSSSLLPLSATLPTGRMPRPCRGPSMSTHTIPAR